MGKGALYSLFSHTLFVTGSFAIHWFFTHKLDQSGYGIFGVCMSILTISYIFLNNGVRQTVSKNISISPNIALSIFKKAAFIQLFIASILSLIIVFLGIFAEVIFKDINMRDPLFICAIIVVLQGLIFVSVGAFNGAKDFKTESMILSIHAILRTVVPIILILISQSLVWGLLGFVISGVLTFAVCLSNCSKLPRGKIYQGNFKDIIVEAFPSIVIFGVITLLMNLDLIFLKVLVLDDTLTGVYTAAATLAKPPYWIMASIGSTILPFMVNVRLSSSDFVDRFVKLIQICMAILLPSIVIVVFYNQQIIGLVYGADYLEGSIPFILLVVAILAQGAINIYANIFIGMGKAVHMMMFSVLGISLHVLLLMVLIPQLGMVGASFATMLSSLLVLMISMVYLRQFVRFHLFEFEWLFIGKLVLGLLSLVGLLFVGQAFNLNFVGVCVLGYIITLVYYLKVGVVDINNILGALRQ